MSEDGLVVEAQVSPDCDAEAISALGAGVARNLGALSRAANRGDLRQAVIDGAQGATILQPLPSGALLIVLAREDGDLGQLLYEVRRHAPALVPLL